MGKAAIWSAYCVKRPADGSRISHCTLKTDDGKACVYSYIQKKGDVCTSTLIKQGTGTLPRIPFVQFEVYH
uniref:Uncharacterized protein n=1 Tax=Panagrolaimus davidi TaxID=227884 RepID=A0A914Q698_9BILA